MTKSGLALKYETKEEAAAAHEAKNAKDVANAIGPLSTTAPPLVSYPVSTFLVPVLVSRLWNSLLPPEVLSTGQEDT